MSDDVQRVLRATVPVDGLEHSLSVSGRIVHVACKHADDVELWFIAGRGVGTRVFTVTGTGQGIEGAWTYVGTALAEGGALVWHVWELA